MTGPKPVKASGALSKSGGRRNPGIELLRVISMLMIVTLHYLGQGGVLDRVKAGTVNYYFAWTAEAFCYVSVNCFVLISGYFLLQAKFRVKKLLLLIVQTVFYSVAIYAVFCLCGVETFRAGTLVTGYMFPVIHGEYWFVTVYAALYLLFPFLNLAISAMSRAQHRLCLIVMTLIFSVIPTVFFFAGSTLGVGYGYSLIWFVYLYLLAAYLRLYPVRIKTCRLLCGFILLPLLAAVCRYSAVIGRYWDFYRYTSAPVLAASVCLFLVFTRVEIKNGVAAKILCAAASCTFGVFLIHTQYVMRDVWLWNSVVKAFDQAGSPYLPLHMAGWVLAIYLSCTVIEFLRKLVFRPLENSRPVDQICGNADRLLRRLIEPETCQRESVRTAREKTRGAVKNDHRRQ